MKKIISFIVCAIIVSHLSLSFAKGAVSGVVNVNTATKAELMLLPWIGEAKATAIMAQRTQKPFATKEDLVAVKGIGDKLLAKIAPYVAVQGATTIQTTDEPAPAKQSTAVATGKTASN